MIVKLDNKDGLTTVGDLEKWFTDTVAGRYAAACERRFFAFSAKDLQPTCVVQTGMGKWLPADGALCVGRDVYMKAGVEAWADGSLDLLLMPHTCECRDMPAELVLAEAFRVLAPEGRLILTGFNPHSLWGYGGQLPECGSSVALPLMKNYARAAGFSIERGQFMVYVPPVGSETALKFWRFMESAGNRWWPHAAAVYGLVLLKREAGLRPLLEREEAPEETDGMILGMAKTEAE